MTALPLRPSSAKAALPAGFSLLTALPACAFMELLSRRVDDVPAWFLRLLFPSRNLTDDMLGMLLSSELFLFMLPADGSKIGGKSPPFGSAAPGRGKFCIALTLHSTADPLRFIRFGVAENAPD